MDNATQINACAFFIKDEEGQIREAGIVAFDRLRSAIKIELLASEMDDSVPFSSITTAIDVLREQFDVPIIKVPKTKTIAIRPNPAKS